MVPSCISDSSPDGQVADADSSNREVDDLSTDLTIVKTAFVEMEYQYSEWSQGNGRAKVGSSMRVGVGEKTRYEERRRTRRRTR